MQCYPPCFSERKSNGHEATITTNMTLGDLIKRLEAIPPETVMRPGIGNPHSWRGRYEELSFEPVEETTVGKLLEEAKGCIGRTFCGYKGGEYTMSERSTVNIDEYGHWSDGNAIWDLALSAMLGSSHGG